MMYFLVGEPFESVWLALAEIFGLTLGIVFFSFLLAVLPSGIYWLFRKEPKGLVLIASVAWIIVCSFALYGAYLTGTPNNGFSSEEHLKRLETLPYCDDNPETTCRVGDAIVEWND